MAADKGNAKGAQSKCGFKEVVSTPGRESASLPKKQARQAIEEEASGSSSASSALNAEIIQAINTTLGTKLDQLASRIENMVTTKLGELEKKLQNTEVEVKKLTDDVDNSINLVESVLKQDINLTWEYVFRKEQYLRKNNLRVLNLVPDQKENLEVKFIKLVEDNLQEEISANEIDIIHRTGKKKRRRRTRFKT